MIRLVETLRLSLHLLLTHPRRLMAAVLGLTLLIDTLPCVFTYYLPLVLK